MIKDEPSPSTRLPDPVVRRVLTRAAELEVARPGGLTVQELREIAAEAGLSPSAVDAALAEIRPADGGEPAASPATAVPAWVRLCMAGVPDRRAAKVYYWLFVALLLATPVWTALWGPSDDALRLWAGLGAAGFLGFATWSTGAAIRWLDRHGWDRLR